MANISPRHAVAAMALLAESGSAHVADESVITASQALVIECDGADYSYALIDILLDVDGKWVIIEVNGANGAGSVAHDGDGPRVEHLLDTADARGMDGDIIAIAFQADTPCRPEIFARAAQIATMWEERSGAPVSLVGAATDVAPKGRCVLIGSTEEIASVLAVDAHGRLVWRDRKIVLLSNANVIPALIRRGVIGAMDALDLQVLHEGALVAPLIHEKGSQQELAAGTGFRPLQWDSAQTETDAVVMIQRMSLDKNIVVKINGGSGGTGVFPVAKGARLDVIRSALSAALGKTAAKYGSTATAYPIRAFEFAEAWAVGHTDGSMHLWDLRLQILARPGSIEVTPLSARICPAPFDGTLNPAAVICNLTGTEDGANRVVPADELFQRLGITEVQVAALAQAAAAWMVNAQATA